VNNLANKDKINFLFFLLSIIFIIISWKKNGFIFSIIYLFVSLYVLSQTNAETPNRSRINFIIGTLILLNLISFALQFIKYLYKIIFTKSTITIFLIGLLIFFVANPDIMIKLENLQSLDNLSDIITPSTMR
jgi:hypothetical protein